MPARRSGGRDRGSNCLIGSIPQIELCRPQKQSAVTKMLVTAQECPRRLDDWCTAWRREHANRRANWACGLRMGSWGSGVQFAASGKGSTSFAVGFDSTAPWSRACAGSLAIKILNSLGVRALPGSFVDIGQTEGHHPMRNGSADKTSGEDPAS